VTSQRLVEEFAAWLWQWDTGHIGDGRVPDNYLNEAAIFLAGELGQRLQRVRLQAVEELFAGGPDTPCRTTWREHRLMLPGDSWREECVEVPMADLRTALGAAS
jgi:hypothetical protein